MTNAPSLPSALEALSDIKQRSEGRPWAFFLDVDGTLAPIVPHPDAARVATDTRALLRRMAQEHVVCMASGRGLDDLRSMVDLSSVYYAASHGYQIVGPAGSDIELEVGGSRRQDLETVVPELEEALCDIRGVVMEDAGLSLSVHYRLVAKPNRPLVERVVKDVAARHPRLRLGRGKCVYEFGPREDWDKGKAMLWLLDRLGKGPADTVPLCIGDDLTDENLFVAAQDWGVSVVVGALERPTAAGYQLRDPNEVVAFLQALVGPEPE